VFRTLVLCAALVPTVALGQSITGPSSSQSPYVTPTRAGVTATSVLTVGDSIGGYLMVGLPDGLGAYDNLDGTFTLLMNHEIAATSGAVRAHGASGAFVSEWVIRKSDFTVLSGVDLATQHYVWNTPTSAYSLATGNAAPNRIGRLCSADLPPVSAFYDAASGLGTTERVFMNGEEVGAEGRAYGWIATGPAKGQVYELPWLGRFSRENSSASPFSGAKTVVVGMDDSTPGQVYVYVGDKAATGSDIERAGLVGGSLFGVKGPVPTENGAQNGAFTLAPVIGVQSGSALQTQSNLLGITNFARPEDGNWYDADTFFFATTGADPDGGGPIGTQPARLYGLDFDPAFTGGTISVALEATSLVGSDGLAARAFDNFDVGDDGLIYIQEDPGNSSYIAKTWQFDPTTGVTRQLLESDRTRFVTGGSRFLTQDEENSGIIDITSILGRSDGVQYLMATNMAHYFTGPTLVEGGQLYAVAVPPAAPGDYNADGPVDAQDYTAWVAAYGQSEGRADGNRDGAVDVADYTVWRDAAGAASVAVAEPAAGTLVALALLATQPKRGREP
jgi:hypothetical protein